MTMDVDESSDGIVLSSAATTIDPSVVQSRIRQSASISTAEEEDQPVFPKLTAARAMTGANSRWPPSTG